MKRKVMLYPPCLNHNFLRQTPQQIATQFARNGYDVIFCNNSQKNLPPEEVEPNVYVHHNFEDVLRKIKHKQIKVDVFYYTWAKSVEYIDQIKAKINIYNRVDEFPDWQKYETEAINKADLIFTTSQLLFDKTNVNKPTYLIRNACPESYINKSSEVPVEFLELKNNKMPIILMSGAIGTWISTRILRKVADRYNVFLVGQEFGKDCPQNVTKLGVKSHEDLHAYYQHADVSLIPFNLRDGITQSSCPLKLFEALACSTISVATRWHETDIYPEVVLTAETDDEFLDQVEKAIQMSRTNKAYINEKCKQIASQNTWEKRFEEIEGAISDYCNKNGVAI